MPRRYSWHRDFSNGGRASVIIKHCPEWLCEQFDRWTLSSESLQDWELVDDLDVDEAGGSSSEERPSALINELQACNQGRPSSSSILHPRTPPDSIDGTAPSAPQPTQDGSAVAVQSSHASSNDPPVVEADKQAKDVDASTPDLAPTQSKEVRDRGPELYPCTSCGSYHYYEKCVYLLLWTDWLEYHYNFMSSQPYSFSYDKVTGSWTPTKETDITNLHNKAEQLDLMRDFHRPNHLDGSRLKADLMTKSGREMWYEERDFRARQATRPARSVATERGGPSFSSPLDGTSGTVEDDDGDDSDDESLRIERIQSLRTELSKRLPRTSTATLGNNM